MPVGVLGLDTNNPTGGGGAHRHSFRFLGLRGPTGHANGDRTPPISRIFSIAPDGVLGHPRERVACMCFSEQGRPPEPRHDCWGGRPAASARPRAVWLRRLDRARGVPAPRSTGAFGHPIGQAYCIEAARRSVAPLLLELRDGRPRWHPRARWSLGRPCLHGQLAELVLPLVDHLRGPILRLGNLGRQRVGRCCIDWPLLSK